MEIGTVRLVNIESEMRSSYLDYSMSVIVPDVRDGMKPVQRRILYSLHEMGLRRSGRHRKSAGIVGEVMKNYHPHGDQSIYDALVRMAQPWSVRYPLIDGQGNFGSVDGDPPAAMRYCVTGDTLVVTERGLERADQISADGDEAGAVDRRQDQHRQQVVRLRSVPDAARHHSARLRGDRHDEPPPAGLCARSEQGAGLRLEDDRADQAGRLSGAGPQRGAVAGAAG
jgi:hypothetical protein